MADEILRREEGLLSTVIINRSHRRNALNQAALAALGDVFSEFRRQDRPRVIVLRGTGQEAFCSGGDLAGASDRSEFRRFVETLEYCLQSLEECPWPVIAMIYGHCLGAGLDLVTAADLRLAADNALFAANTVKIGRVYYYTSALRLVNLVGWGAAAEMLLTGRSISAARAREIGLTHGVFAGDGLENATYALAREMAEENSLIAVRGTKAMLKKLREGRPLDPAAESELKSIIEAVNQSPDAAEGARAFFEKRQPLFFKG